MRTVSTRRLCALVVFATLAVAAPVRAQQRSAVEDGYDLWMRYRPLPRSARLDEYRAAITGIAVPGAASSPTLRAAREELVAGLTGLLGHQIASNATMADGSVVVGTPTTLPSAVRARFATLVHALPRDGYVLRATTIGGKRVIVVAGNTDAAALYGAFRVLRQVQTERPLAGLSITDAPRIERRLLDHWDNLDRTVERGYAGQSLWDWARLPDSLPPAEAARYRDYARANASIGINGAALTNVNADAKVLTPEYIAKVAALAKIFRPYGIRVYLTALFSAPMKIGGLQTADPLDPTVRAWWRATADRIYAAIPDFGGFLVKANSEGQPGPQDYKRSHADGANMLADAVAPHGGIVMWRAFVYSNEVPVDRTMQAYDEFKPLDGAFRDNVLVQVKNGPLDFQPREPFSPLFGAMTKTPLMMEFQITKEYLGEDTHLVYLGALYEEVLTSDTWAKGAGSTVARAIDGSLYHETHTGIAGVSNVGTDRDWTGSDFNQANWYAFGRLAWDPTESAANIADDWIRMTFTNDSVVVDRVKHMMLVSRDAVVNYMTPLGLAHLMGTGHHYGPAPWVARGRADQTPVYFHRADSVGLGFDRTPRGSNAAGQYSSPLRDDLANRDSTPEKFLLWFHHVGWTDRLKSGQTLWDALAAQYNVGVDTVRSMQRTWASLATSGSIDSARFASVTAFLHIQEREAVWWRDASLSYFQTFSHLPIPPQFEQPAHPLSFYQALRCPVDRTKPRCPEMY